MSQEIEIEYKALLTKKEYEQLSKQLPFPNEVIEQTNYYFETESFDLKKKKSALRIREKNDTYQLTLKEPYVDGILETHDTLVKEEFLSWINGKPISKPNVAKQLQALQIVEDDLIYFGSLKTERKTFVKDGVEYVLDKSMYNDKEDYELEIEAPTKKKGLAAFEEVLQKYHIKNKDSVTKIERFFYSRS